MHIPTDSVGTSRKKKGCGKKKNLVFKVEQAQDNKNIFEGRVQENIKDTDPDNEKDRSYSIKDTDREYEPFAIPGDTGREINIDNGLRLLTKNLANDGFIPLMGFQSNSAFNSLQNSPVTRKDPLPTDQPWRKGETRPNNDWCSDTETPIRTNTVEPKPRPKTGMPTQTRSAIPPVENNNLNPTPSDKHIVVLSNEEGNKSEDLKAQRLVRKLLNDEKRVRTEVLLSDLGMMAPTEVTVAKAFAHGQAKKAFEQLGMRDISSDTEEFIIEYNANLTTILIGRSFMAPDIEADRPSLKVNSFTE